MDGNSNRLSYAGNSDCLGICACRCRSVFRTVAAMGCAVFAAWCWPVGPGIRACAQPPNTTQSAAAVTQEHVDVAASADRGIRERLLEANRILTVDTTPALFRELCEDTSARPALLAAVRRAQQQLDDASRELAKLAASESRDALEVQRDQLTSFVNLFASLGELTQTPASRQRVVAACGELATLFDVEDKRIAESAKLWQGAAYRRAGRSDRALQVLRPVLARPASPAAGFWARLERARALCDEKRFAAGAALCLRIESLSADWFKDAPEDVAAARRTAQQVRAAILAQWAKDLESRGQAGVARETATRARTLAESLVRVPETRRLLGLKRAVDSLDSSVAGNADGPASGPTEPQVDVEATEPDDADLPDESEEDLHEEGEDDDI